MTSKTTIGRIALRMLCALSLLFVSFAHQPMAMAKAPDGLSIDYMLPDGTFADLCLSDQVYDPAGKSPAGKGIAKTGCEACRLSASIILPQPAGCSFDVPRTVTVLQALPPTATVVHAVLSLDAPPRGPPLPIATV